MTKIHTKTCFPSTMYEEKKWYIVFLLLKKNENKWTIPSREGTDTYTRIHRPLTRIGTNRKLTEFINKLTCLNLLKSKDKGIDEKRRMLFSNAYYYKITCKSYFYHHHA